MLDPFPFCDIIMTFFRPLKLLVFFAALTLCAGLSAGASAQQGLLPTGDAVSVDAQLATDEETHPPLRLTPDRSEILTVEEEVERVIIGNDVHLNILLDSSKRLIMVPRAPGATHFTLLGKDGKILMQRHAIIAGPKEQYVRVRHPCRGEGECMPIRVYYCPGLCHEVGIVGEGNATFTGSMPMISEDDRRRDNDDDDAGADGDADEDDSNDRSDRDNSDNDNSNDTSGDE